MRSGRIRRLAGVGVLTLVLLMMFIHYGAVADRPGHDPSFNAEETLAAQEEIVGQELYFWARVESTTAEGMLVSVGDQRVRVVESNANVQAGDAIQVAGVAKPGGVVQADRVVVSHEENLVYLYLVSALGGVVTLVHVFRHWRIQWADALIVPRGE